MGCTFERNTRRSRIAIVFIILNIEIKNKPKISNNRGKDVFSNKKRKVKNDHRSEFSNLSNWKEEA